MQNLPFGLTKKFTAQGQDGRKQEADKLGL